MIWVIRIGLIVGSVLVVKPAGRILAVLFVADLSQPGFLAELGIIVVFCVGVIALLVSAADRLFGSVLLLAFAALGCSSIGLTRLGLSCSNVNFAIPSYDSYLCASPSMTLGLAGICVAFLLIVTLRYAGVLPKPDQAGRS